MYATFVVYMNNDYLLRLHELRHKVSVVPASCVFWIAGDEFDERTDIFLEQVVDDGIVVVVVSHTIDTVHVVPNGVAKRRRIYVCVSAHPVYK